MKTFKEIYKEVEKIIGKQPKVELNYTNDYINYAFEEMYKICPLPTCRKQFKNWRGTRIHMSKKHGWTKKAEAKYVI